MDRNFHTTKLWDPGGPRHKDRNGDPMYFDFKWFRNPGSEVLVIAGDLADEPEYIESCLREACEHYPHVVFVDGNHDHRRMESIPHGMDFFTDLKVNLPNLIFLDGEQNPRSDIGSTAFIGGNSWYDWRCYEDRGITWLMALDRWEQKSHDASMEYGDWLFPSNLARAHFSAIKAEYDAAVADPNIKNIVMVTHTVPHVSGLEWRMDPEFNLGSPSFCNSEMGQIVDNADPKLKLWIYGHTHFRRKYYLGDLALINNAYGYPHEVRGQGWFMDVFEV